MSSLPGAVLEAAAHGRWHDVLTKLIEAAGADSGGVLIRTTDSRKVLQLETIGHDAASERAYVSEWAAKDPTLPWLDAVARNRWEAADMWTDSPYRGHDAFIDGYLRPHRLRQVMVTRVGVSHGVETLIGLQRGQTASRFDPDRPLLVELRASIEHAAREHSARVARKEIVEASLLQWAEWAPVPVMLCAADGSVIGGNRAGNAVLVRGEPVALRGDGVVHCPGDSSATSKLLAALRAGVMARIRILQPGSSQHLVQVASGGASGKPDAPRIVSIPTAMPVPGEKTLRDALALSVAEARIVRQLLVDDDIEGCAARLGIKTDSVRTQLKRIYARTGVSGRTELLRLAANVCDAGALYPFGY